MLTHCRRFHSALVPILTALVTTGVSAQVLEEVVVTAQKREQSLQDVGIAVTAFTGDQQRALGFKNTTDISLHTPGLQTFNFGNGAANVFMVRGVGQIDFGDHQEQAVAVYTDGAYNSYLGGVGFALFDIERIEVLKGPQGTLYGRNATGGVVHVLTAKPTRHFESYAETQFTEYDGYRGEFAVSGPLTQTLSARFAGVKDKADGWVDNNLGEDGHDTDNTNARLSVLWEPRDDFDVLVSGSWGTYDNNNPTYVAGRAISDNSVLNGGPITGGLDDGLSKAPPSAQAYADFCNGFWANPTITAATPANIGCLQNFGIGNHQFADGVREVNIPEYGTQFPGGAPAPAGAFQGQPDGRSNREQYGFTGTMTWDIRDDLKAVYIGDFRKFTKDYREDADGTAVYVSDFWIRDDSHQWSHEIRLEGLVDEWNLQWTTGFYYLRIDHTMFGGMDTGLVFGSNLNNHTDLVTNTYAGFVQGEWEFHPQWTAIVGLRWTEDEKDFDLVGNCINTPAIAGFGNSCNLFYTGLVNNNSEIHTSRSEGEWSGTFELNFRPTDDWLLYAKFSRGNKAGGYNTGFLTLFSPSAVEFDGEILENYEGGFKSTWMDGRTRFNATVFYYDYTDFQSFFQFGTNFSVQNVDATVLGGEVELITNPMQGLEFAFGLSALDAEQKDIATALVTRDRPMPFAPDLTFNGLGRYEWPMLAGHMHVQMDFAYTDEYTMNAIDHPSLTQDDYWIANARIGWTSENGRWEAAAWVKNFTDTDYFVNGFDTATFSGSVILVPGAPRIFGGTLRFNWD